MSLKPLPDLRFPIVASQSNALMDNVVQLNLMEAGLNPRQQQALGIIFDIYDVLAKTGGLADYRSREGHSRIYQEAMNLISSGSPIVTRQGDLKAAHLAIDYNDTLVRLANAKMPPAPAEISDLILESVDLANLPPRELDRIALYLRYRLKK